MTDVVVSVVIPVHNQTGTLCQAVDSALCQDVALEVIVVDDASTVDVRQVLAPYMSEGRDRACEEGKDGAGGHGWPVRLLRNQENRGAARSRNRGVRAARGRYVAFLDSDDWWEPGKLRKQLRLMEKTGDVLCCSGRRLITPDGGWTSRTIGVRPVIR